MKIAQKQLKSLLKPYLSVQMPPLVRFQDHAPLASQIVYIRGRLIFGSDEYWKWLWAQPTLPGRGGKPKVNALFEKYGRKDAAPFDSCFMVFGWGLTLEQRVKLDSYGRSEWPQGTVLVEDWYRQHYPEAAECGAWKRV